MLGLVDIAVAGGMESMSNSPFYLTKARYVSKQSIRALPFNAHAWEWSRSRSRSSRSVIDCHLVFWRILPSPRELCALKVK